MKKLILVGFLAFGVLGFSRFVKECHVTSKTSKSVTCKSNESEKTFQFTSGRLSSVSSGYTYKIYFQGNGYRGLRLTSAKLLAD
ncbi:hypothetical protein [Leptotrichia sp. oral taxon 879]|uniref:Uncharacterized protein n=1 Tax=Leptotrichia mesophila TaxID=3239303 RepID=A0AB39VB61_9FUSO|nr:hypothetical protein [Leptotrichia sp. oral taxon 879]ERK55070.1 hypothetical protein HMPREF1552_00293 [Leptotrichia sp. oral taxon 879 str. F0557]